MYKRARKTRIAEKKNGRGIKKPNRKPPSNGPTSRARLSKALAVPIVTPCSSVVSLDIRAVIVGLEIAEPNPAIAPARNRRPRIGGRRGMATNPSDRIVKPNNIVFLSPIKETILVIRKN